MSIYLIDADKNVTLTLNGQTITDFSAGDIIALNPVNDLVNMQYGAKGNTMVTYRVDRDVTDLNIRLLRPSNNYTVLSNLIGTSLFQGTLAINYTSNSGLLAETFSLENGHCIKNPTLTWNNTDGNNDVEFVIRFARVIKIA